MRPERLIGRQHFARPVMTLPATVVAALDGAVMAPLAPVGLLDHSGHDGRLGNTAWDLAPDAVPPGPERRIDGGEDSPPGDAALEDGCVDALRILADGTDLDLAAVQLWGRVEYQCADVLP